MLVIEGEQLLSVGDFVALFELFKGVVLLLFCKFHSQKIDFGQIETMGNRFNIGTHSCQKDDTSACIVF